MSADCVIIPSSRASIDLHVRDAVDADEIAAVLEASGITDAVAAGKYGHPDVFSLAATLLPHSGPTVRLEPRAPNPVGESVLRGVVFAVPGLVAAALPVLSSAPLDRLTVMVAVVTGWSVSHALAGRGYLRLAVDRYDAWRATVAAAGVVGITATVLAAAAVWWLGVGPWIGVVAAAQVIYSVAATTALLFGGVRLTLLALVPAVLAAVDAGLRSPSPITAAGYGLTLTVVCAVAAAVRPPSVRTVPPRQRLPGHVSHTRRVFLYGAYGAASATLLLSGLTPDPAVFALVVSVIAIELEIANLLTRGRARLRSCTSQRLLKATAWRLLGAAMLRYAVLVATLAGITRPDPQRLVWVVALGLVFLVGGILVAHQDLAPAVALTGTTAVAALGFDTVWPVVALAVALTVVTGVRLGSPEAHR